MPKVFPTFWAILELKRASDSAILSGMKVAVGDAGVDPLDGLLLDDIMDQYQTLNPKP